MKKLTKVIISICLMFVLMVSCTLQSEVRNKKTSAGGAVDLLAPENIQVKFDGNDLLISWDPVPGISTFEIYRKDGNGDFYLIYKGPIQNNDYLDRSGYDPDQTVQYAVKSVIGTRSSLISLPSNAISRYVLNVSASRFEYTNKINIIWSEQSIADSYNLYRMINKDDLTTNENTVQIKNITGSVYTDFYDLNISTSPQVDKPYYYLVTWTKEGIEYGTEAVKVMGVYGATIDYHETNDHWTHLSEQKISSQFNSNEPPMLYSFDNGVKDEDWYIYIGPPTSFNITVILDEGTLFTSGINFQFFTDYPFYSDQDPNNLMDQFLAEKVYPDNNGILLPFDFTGYEGDLADITDGDGNTKVYFRVFPDFTDINKIGPYQIVID